MNGFTGFNRVSESLRKELEVYLESIGLLCRVFGRGKSLHSLNRKISKEPGKYDNNGKLIQDAVGLRVVLYFPEDIDIVQSTLKAKYSFDKVSSTIDTPQTSVFAVTRHNLIFRIPDEHVRDMRSSIQSQPIDTTFEVQIRTILSEGWHEVEHDLRYKRKEDWESHDDLSRGLNGVVATLETAEWSMRKIFDDLAHRHYKNHQWAAMLHTAIRMRVNPEISPEICTAFDNDILLAKEMHRINRPRIFKSLASLAPKIPLTLDNIVYLWNHIETKHPSITRITPEILTETFLQNLQSSDMECTAMP